MNNIYIILNDSKDKFFREYEDCNPGNSFKLLTHGGSQANLEFSDVYQSTNGDLYLKKYKFLHLPIIPINAKTDKINEIIKSYFKNILNGINQNLNTKTAVFFDFDSTNKASKDTITFLKKVKPSWLYFWNFGKTYIMNKTFFNNSYSTFKKNIPHEVINLFSTDNGKRYFYLCKDGKLNDFITQNNKPSMKNNYIDMENAVLVNYTNLLKDKEKTNRIMLQKIEGLKPCDIAFGGTEEVNDIKYNNKLINDIFAGNSYLGFDKYTGETTITENYPFVTFKLKEDGKVYQPEVYESTIFVAKNPTESTTNNDDNQSITTENLPTFVDSSFTRSNCRQFVLEGTKLFDDLDKIINKTKWCEEKNQKLGDYKTSDDFKIDMAMEKEYVLKTIQEPNHETYFSKLITFMIENYKDITNDFLDLKGVQKILSVQNEDFNIDILFTFEDKNNEKHLVVIENKIEANFNDINKKEIKNFFNDIKLDEKSKNLLSSYDNEYKNCSNKNQLTKYFYITQILAKMRGVKKENIHYFILAPEYKKNHYDNVKNSFCMGDKYKVISYKKLSNEISKYLGGISNSSQKEVLTELYKAIQPFTSDYCSYFSGIAKSRFANA